MSCYTKIIHVISVLRLTWPLRSDSLVGVVFFLFSESSHEKHTAGGARFIQTRSFLLVAVSREKKKKFDDAESEHGAVSVCSSASGGGRGLRHLLLSRWAGLLSVCRLRGGSSALCRRHGTLHSHLCLFLCFFVCLFVCVRISSCIKTKIFTFHLQYIKNKTKKKKHILDVC